MDREPPSDQSKKSDTDMTNPKQLSSEELVAAVLAERFELTEGDLSEHQVLELLIQAIRELPGEGTKVLSIVGGAASGKGTLARSLIEALEQQGIMADSIGTDDFNRGDRAWRWEHFEGQELRDPHGKYNFDLMNQKIEAIKQNRDGAKTIPVPTYDQVTGLAIDAGEENYTHKIGKVDVLIVEGDFHPVEHPDLVIFLHLPDEERRQNRVKRDLIERGELGADPEKTIKSFNLRQKNQHIPYTLPEIKAADIVLNADPAEEAWKYDVYRAGSAPVA